jgi:hypothetical protein
MVHVASRPEESHGCQLGVCRYASSTDENLGRSEGNAEGDGDEGPKKDADGNADGVAVGVGEVGDGDANGDGARLVNAVVGLGAGAEQPSAMRLSAMKIARTRIARPM